MVRVLDRILTRVVGTVCVGILSYVFTLFTFSYLAPRPAEVLVWEPTYEDIKETPGMVVGSGAVDTPTVSGTRLLFVGDIMLDRNVATRSRAAGSLSYPFQRLPAGWFEVFDLAIGNLEGPVTDQRRPPEKSIDFQFDPAVIPILKAQGIDAVSQANNHALDQGRIGSDDSRARLKAAGFLTFGDQVRDDAIALATTTVSGIRLAFVGFNTTDNPLDREAASTTLAHARQSADQVIVFMHWGSEYKDQPDPSTVETAHWLIDHGTDLVIGAHPHWVQGFSVYKGKPIAWSLGNFIFDQDWSAETRQGLALAVTVKGKTIELEPIPLQIDVSQPRLVEGEIKVNRLERLAEISDEPLREQVRAGTIRLEIP